MIHQGIKYLAGTMALCGGLVLCVVVGVVCTSIAGRALADFSYSGALGDLGETLIEIGVGPILGDFELVEAGIAFAIFAFLPITQLKGAHAKVDVFSRSFGPRADRALGVFWTVVMAAIILLITWRLYEGMHDKLRYNETTFLIQFPVWWAYAACLAAASVASLTSLYCAFVQLTDRNAHV